MRHCPHCGQPVRDDDALCPFCGTDVETGKQSRPIESRGGDGVAGGTLGCVMSGLIYWFCGALYMIAGNILVGVRHEMPHVNQHYWLFWRTDGPWIGFGVPILITGLTYLLLRRRFPAFARGLGYSGLIACAVALGAPFLCGHNR